MGQSFFVLKGLQGNKKAFSDLTRDVGHIWPNTFMEYWRMDIYPKNIN
jgi:hypothetical protein